MDLFFSAIRDSYWLPIHKDNAEILGVFGDFFGGTLNPILTFIALIFIIKSYRMQKEEFKELVDANKNQVDLLKTQNTKDLTFKMLEKWEILLENYKSNNKSNNRFTNFIQDIESFINNFSSNVKGQCELILISHRQPETGELYAIINRMEDILLFFNDFELLWETESIDKYITKQLFRERFKKYFLHFYKIEEAFKGVLEENKHNEELYKCIEGQKDIFKEKFQDLMFFYKENFEEKK